MDNLKKVQKAVKDSNVDGLLVSSLENKFYTTGFASIDGIALVTENDLWFFTDSRYTEAAEMAVKGGTVVEVGGDNPYSRAVKKIITENMIESLGFEESAMNVADYLVWNDRFDLTMMPMQKLFTLLRASKSREELAAMIEAQRFAEKVFNEILAIISTDMTEKELAAEMIYRFLKYGAEDVSFPPIVVSGPRSSMPHGVPTDNKIEKGFLTMDFGVKLHGWCSDTTRTVSIGKPTEEMRRVYNTVLQAQLKGIEKAAAGVTGKDVDMAAREYIHSMGYGGRFGHGFGHGLGLQVHEAPTLSPSGEAPLPVGAVVSAEPGIYIPGEFGVRIEDVLYIVDGGCENITNLPKDLIIL